MAETITAVKVLGIKEEQEVVVAYASKHLSDRETKWSTTEKEAYAIHAVKTFYPYLYGRPFKVYTDHRPLQWLMNVQDPTGKLARWWLELQKFQIEIEYKPGKKNQNADLSRTPIFEATPVANEDTVCLIIEEWKTSQVRDDNIKRMRIRESAKAEGEGKARC